ncbi:hypothetical protein T01_7675 [Trichinella spiralis]|uniref:Uncharacterized protein n=1 Tax=Trichinella spiralis TaxID=6334 RepID=A0A0V1BZM8_TRISP|nr:hypothetical protein T01_7675 [Trichinella spiralis]
MQIYYYCRCFTRVYDKLISQIHNYSRIILPDIKHKCLNVILHIILSIFIETDVLTFMEKLLTIALIINILFLDFGLAKSYNLKKIPFSLITSTPKCSTTTNDLLSAIVVNLKLPF